MEDAGEQERRTRIESLGRLDRFKSRLSSLSLYVGVSAMFQIMVLAVNGLLLISQRPSGALAASTGLLFAISGFLFLCLVVAVVMFERTVRSARIYSAELSDSLGWYSSYTSPAADEVSARPDWFDDKASSLQARVLLREIAENSYLPLSRGDSAPFLYAAFSLTLLVVHFFVAYLVLAGVHSGFVSPLSP